ncbi:MAG: M23 family metallopeptidase [Chloroflexi bacterium]|nr:M23 family metallopeptidase [Chloroflexota bacterium]MCY3938059.1 M23 family metallopeptidase [Chloroflexota bacterium]
MRALRLAALVVPLLLASYTGALPVGAGAPPCAVDYPVANGHFYSQTGEDTGRGFVVFDDHEARFWTAFQNEGGIPTLGFPVSSRYRFKGLPTQAFQKAILQWDSAKRAVNFLNTLDELSLAGRDPELLAFRQTPPHVALIEDAGLNPTTPEGFSKIVQNHLQILTQNPLIQERFESESRWLELYGLPVSYADFGPVQVLRAQRQVFQVWTVDDGGGPKGVPVLANSGDVAKEFGLIPPEAITPVEPPDGTETGELTLELVSSQVRQGDVLVVRVLGSSGPVTISLGSIVAPAVCDAGEMRALLPISSISEPGNHTLQAKEGVFAAPVEFVFSVTPVDYPFERLYLSPEVESLLTPEDIQAERALLESIFGTFTTERRWDGPFIIPASGPPTSPFGERRVYGDSGLYDYHGGHDVAAPTGTPVLASQKGTVAWAGPLKIRGNTVIIDHGRSVFSAYLHLSEINVNVGDQLETGDLLGAVGNTGLSTGPHLHWEIRVLNVPVDPLPWTQPGPLTR